MAKKYDPAKAHEYYERTKKLKGRKKGREAVAAVGKVLGAKGTATPTSNARQLREQRAKAREQVIALKQRLGELERELKKAMAEAEDEARESAKEAAKPDTAAEKADKARDAKKYRDKNEQKLKTEAATKAAKESGSGGGSSKSDTTKSGSTTKQDKVEELKAAVDNVKSALNKAVAKRRALG